MKILLKGGNVYENGRFRVKDVRIENGCFTDAFSQSIENVEVKDISGLYVFPGFVDVHVHFREPGFEYKETIRSGSSAAAAGGYTTVCTMPNLNPAPDTAPHLERQLEAIRRSAVVNVIPYGTITMRQAGGGELSDMAAMKDSVVGFSDDGRGVQDDATMEAAMKTAAALGKPVVAHCEVNSLLHGGYIHDGEYARSHGHKGICSESEWRQVERDLQLAARTGCQYHVCHVSTKESVELVRRAKAAGLKATCETAPHYLLLDEGDLQEDGRFKMNPPLRSASDREALLRGIIDGTVEVIATDHAPHSAEEKSKGLQGSAFGIVGLETAFAVMYTGLVKNGVITLEKLVELMSVNPRRIFGMCEGLADGTPADLTIFDLNDSYIIDPARFLSQGKATPFAGREVCGRCVATIVNGSTVFENGRIVIGTACAKH